jgi:hypothetical protein
MAGRKLARNTTVGTETFEAGTVPPPEVAKLIDNPDVWEPEEHVVEDTSPPAEEPKKK